jgi:hypothetical protein
LKFANGGFTAAAGQKFTITVDGFTNPRTLAACGTWQVKIGNSAEEMQEVGTAGSVTSPKINAFASASATAVGTSLQNGGTSSYKISFVPLSKGSFLATDTFTLTVPSLVSLKDSAITGGSNLVVISNTEIQFKIAGTIAGGATGSVTITNVLNQGSFEPPNPKLLSLSVSAGSSGIAAKTDIDGLATTSVTGVMTVPNNDVAGALQEGSKISGVVTYYTFKTILKNALPKDGLIKITNPGEYSLTLDTTQGCGNMAADNNWNSCTAQG